MSVTNDQIRRAHPTVDSPLVRFILGEIDEPEYDRQMAEKRRREDPARWTRDEMLESDPGSPRLAD